MVRYIAIHGKKQFGKDQFAKYVVEYINKNIVPFNINFCFNIKAFATPMKHFLSNVYNIPIEYFYDDKSYVTQIQWIDLSKSVQSSANKIDSEDFLTIRELLQIFGEMIRKEWDCDLWAKSLFLRKEYADCCIISDVRYNNEATYAKKHDAYLIKLIRDGGEVDNHASENQIIPDEMFDAIIHVEEGLDNYKKQVFNFLEQNKRKFFPDVY